jgi:hypothetical protein
MDDECAICGGIARVTVKCIAYADDYDVLADGVVVGRVFKANAAPVGTPWTWTLAFGHHEDRTPTHGYETLHQATGKRKKPVPLSHELGGRHGEETKEVGEGSKKGRQKE